MSGSVTGSSEPIKFATQTLVVGFAIDCEHLQGPEDLTADFLDEVGLTAAGQMFHELTKETVETVQDWFIVQWNTGTFSVHQVQEFQAGFMADDGVPVSRVRVTVRKAYHWV